MKNSMTKTPKTHITADFGEKSLNMTKSFYNKACKIGSAEYKELRAAMADNPDYKINIVTNDKKRSYRTLTIERMRAYIETQPNSKENLLTLDRVIKVAEAKGAKYPLTKKWFLETFPEYKECAVSDNELTGSAPQGDDQEQVVTISAEKAA